MNKNNLIASVSLFAELCNQKKDIQSILVEFIKSVFYLEKRNALNSKEISDFLNKHYDFDIPEAVVKLTLTKMKKSDNLILDKGNYVIDNYLNFINEVSEKLTNKKTEQILIEEELIRYVELKQNKKLLKQDKDALISSFSSYLLDNGVRDDYSSIVSLFIINNSENKDFVITLNQIKEGLVLLQGLKFTNDFNELGKWNTPLTVYIDTEHLFNLAGYNGEVFERLFNDFYELIQEINARNRKKKGEKLIYLKYFEEVENEVEHFFYVAEKILSGDANLDPSKTAMLAICKGCSSPSDVIKKKTSFFTNLKTKGITLKDEENYYADPKFNIEDSQLIEKYKDKRGENAINDVLKSFTKINYLRRGISNTSFEKIEHIILTGDFLTLHLSKDLDIKNKQRDIPFATDIYFITNRFWYKLNKGFSKKERLPLSLDVVSRAQIIISSQINTTVWERYQELKNELKSGIRKEGEVQDYYNNLREKAKKPEEIKAENTDDVFTFIFENDYECYLREKSVLEQKAKEGEVIKSEYRKFRNIVYREKKIKIKNKISRLYCISLIIVWVIIIILISIFGKLLYLLKQPNDSLLTILFGIITLSSILFPLFKWKKIKQYLKRKIKTLYLRKVRSIK